jgi:hypothetical protein
MEGVLSFMSIIRCDSIYLIRAIKEEKILKTG